MNSFTQTRQKLSCPTDHRAIRVVVVEDYPLIRLGLVQMIQNEPLLAFSGEFSSAEAALSALENQPVDVALVDIGLPGMNGIAFIEQLRGPHHASGPDTLPRVVVLTSHQEGELVLAALRAGANGYCLKDTPPEQLLQAIQTVHAGNAWYDAGVLGAINQALLHTNTTEAANEANPIQQERYQRLTERERCILTGITQGQSNAQLAEALCLSVYTVKIHVSHVLKKLEVTDRTQAAILGVQLGLLPAEPLASSEVPLCP
ncbi:MAG: response regulator transcription factor [Candidatus Melainabacteria bacterium]|nr:response regulator transcription factor [Candidatus Melainabacteria bacterium]